MTDTTKNEAAAIEQAGKPKSPPRATKPRMAHERKADGKPAGNAKAEAKTPLAPRANAPGGPSKIASVIALLERAEGATLAEIVEATGWLRHTTRAALTGLKKKGHTIAKDKRGDVTCYRIAKAG